MNELIKCSNCSRLPQSKEEFLGKGDKMYKLCRKCRIKHKRQNSTDSHKELVKKWREDNKEKIKVQTRKAAKAWIEREKEKDVYAYNAKIQATRKKCATSKVKYMEASAIKRGLTWEIPYEKALEMVTSPCVYCGFFDLDKTVNSIDRLDSFKTYTVDNCVSCCAHCNMMKGCYDPDTFIERCKRIGECQLKFQNVPKCDLLKTQTRQKKLSTSPTLDEGAAQSRVQSAQTLGDLIYLEN
jgi:hypothetical protein